MTTKRANANARQRSDAASAGVGSSSASPWRKLAPAAALAPVAILLVAMLAGPIVSGDLWWHLRTGEWILEHGRLPDVDPFSHTARDTHWILQEYGSQVLFALLHGAGGLIALRVVGALLGLALIAAAYRVARTALAPPWAAAATALFALLFALKWELRPHLLSAFFFLRLQHLLFPRTREGARASDWRVWLEVFVLAAVWVQLHAEALFAPILGGACFGGAIAGALLERKDGLRRIGAGAAVFVAALAGSALSPLGLEPHEYALFRVSVPQKYIEEWFPFFGIWPGTERFAPLTLGVFTAVTISMAVSALFVGSQVLSRMRSRESIDTPASLHHPLPWERIAFLCVCIVMAWGARRFFWLTWFPMVDALAWALGRTGLAKRAAAASSVAGYAAALLLALPLASSHYSRVAASLLRRGEWTAETDDRLFPVHAADLIAAAGLEGNLYHPYEWGGYLGFRLRERNPVFIDGRTVLFEEVIPRRWLAERDPIYAARLLDEHDVRVIVFRRLVDHGEGPRAWVPGPAGAWIRAWADARVVVWIRASDEANVGRLAAHYAGAGVPFDPKEGFLEAAVLRAKPEWLRERDLLPAVVAEELEPLYAPEVLAEPDATFARASIYFGANMRRQAAWELETFLRSRLTGEQLELWLERLSNEELGAVLQRARAELVP